MHYLHSSSTCSNSAFGPWIPGGSEICILSNGLPSPLCLTMLTLTWSLTLEPFFFFPSFFVFLYHGNYHTKLNYKHILKLNYSVKYS